MSACVAVGGNVESIVSLCHTTQRCRLTILHDPQQSYGWHAGMTTGPVCGADPAASYQAPTTLQHRRFLSPSTQTDPCRELDASQLLIRCVPTNLSSTVLHLGRAHSWTRISPWGRDDRVAHQQDISAVCAGECVQRTLDAATMLPALAYAATGRETAFLNTKPNIPLMTVDPGGFTCCGGSVRVGTRKVPGELVNS